MQQKKNLPSFLKYFMLLFVLHGCANDPDVQLSGLTSLQKIPLSLKVCHLDVVKDDDGSQNGLPHQTRVDSLMRTPPMTIVEQWAKDRFSLQGGQEGRAVLTIEEAAIYEQPVLSKPTVFQSSLVKYMAQLTLKIEVVNPMGEVQGYATSTSSTSRVLSESATLAEREKLWISLTESALNQLDPVLESRMRQSLSRFL